MVERREQRRLFRLRRSEVRVQVTGYRLQGRGAWRMLGASCFGALFSDQFAGDFNICFASGFEEPLVDSAVEEVVRRGFAT